MSNFWADVEAERIIKEKGKRHVVESGISPSGPYHIGNFREVLTADTLKEALVRAGAKAVHYHFVDDFDPLRKVYPFMPESYAEHVGKPYFLVPDLGDCHQNYAAHFVDIFKKEAEALFVKFNKVFMSHEEYAKGKFVPYIELAIEKQDEIKTILTEISGRDLSDEGPLVQILCSNCRKFKDAQFRSWNKKEKTIDYSCACGNSAAAQYDKGEVKLTWRLDWPARWHLLKVTVEPFGKEHSTKGSSWDTGKEILEKIYKGKLLHPVPYDTINRRGETIKMSASKGNVVTATEALKVMPAEVLRYFVLRSQPKKQIYFDTGLGLYNLIEEFSKVEQAVLEKRDNEFKDAYSYAAVESADRTISRIPFSHIVTAYQSALKDEPKTLEILKRTGYEKIVQEESQFIKKELKFIYSWLNKYAPEEIKFELVKKSPKQNLSKEAKTFIEHLVKDTPSKVKPEEWHEAVYTHAQEAELDPKEAFKTLYKILIGKDFGPRLGYFLASLDSKDLERRLLEASK